MYICKTDLSGERFERLTAIERVVKNGRGYYKCICDCGNEILARVDGLKSGRIKSCGCYSIDRAKSGDNRRTHGKHGTRLYRIWQAMHARCYITTSAGYKNYGKRGIVICPEWVNDFQAFYDWAVLNGYADNLTIDRIDVNGNYEPNNCRWATYAEQASNKRSTRHITYNNEIHTIAEWAQIVGIDERIIRWRLGNNWTIERALTTKPKTVL